MQTSPDVLALEFGVVGKDFIDAHTGGNKVEDDFDGPAHVADAGLTVANIWVEGDAAQI